jgi:LacI family transcriptional regulator
MGEFSRGECDPEWLNNWKGDGIIARIENPEIAKIIKKKAALPTIDVSSARLIPSIPCVETDDKAIAELAFNHFIKCGFKNFAFCGMPYNWSIFHEKHFSKMLKEKDYHFFNYHFSEKKTGEKWNIQLEKLAEWLKQLPKPVGIFAAYDNLGRHIIETCQLSGIYVPEEIAVLGVDNDELMCELSKPRLSSVSTDPFRIGFIAAQLLDRLLSGEELSGTEIRVEPIQVITRKSTDIKAIHDPVISKALHFIHENALKGSLSIDEIVSIVPTSRRVFETRFKKAIGRSPYEEILRLKINRIKELLLDSDMSLIEIAERAGIEHQSYMGYVFKKEMDVSPGHYRKLHR